MPVSRERRRWRRGRSAGNRRDGGLWASPAHAEYAAMDVDGVRLYVGSGTEKREGWISVDANPDLNPHVVAFADRLPMFGDETVAAIEACHLFEHLTFDEARAALKEWRRVLVPGGQLMLELPNLRRCLELLGQHLDQDGFDLALIGIFGWPPAIRTEGVWQIHKWGWTPETLSQELLSSGFRNAEVVPIQQTWRPAARIDRDMRIHATK
ncbi:MAG: class I SAM-dependent methyltransferase [Phenylobacterium sp.]